MGKIFDLQLFTEESTDTDDTKTKQDEEQQQSSPAEESENDQHEDNTAENKKAEIPSELAGISEDVARQIMSENTPEKKEEKQEESASADADSDKKQVDVDEAGNPLEQPQESVPYVRFKEVNNQVKTLKEEIERLKTGNESKQPEQQPVVHEQPAVQLSKQVEPEQQQFKITPEIINKINAVAVSEAMSMTGMSKEDIDALEYSDDKDDKKQLWDNALNIAKTKTINAVNQEVSRQRIAQSKFLEDHTKLVNDFNDFYKQQSAESDFNNVQQYAANDYFNGLSEVDRSVISSAYARVQRNTANPQDIFCIKKYFTDAKNKYRSDHPIAKKPDAAINKTKEKLKEMEKHPKSEQIDGTATSQGGKITVAKLEKMVNTMPWDKVPDEYKKLLLGK